MFIAMNRSNVNPERAGEFEQRWRDRESYLKGQEGFVQFALLKGDEPGDYISHSTWKSRAAFLELGPIRALQAGPQPGDARRADYITRGPRSTRQWSSNETTDRVTISTSCPMSVCRGEARLAPMTSLCETV